ncbi:hypothetical protein [Arenibaculum pallidiluteum]|uniref:hypothetical protein n=1 Tax=Arenibaculum pallidiluteum TaxID=2812559 RepID=UPI001A97CC76|nr:hypothetical protein [Arenibaculum pallidiluteum]
MTRAFPAAPALSGRAVALGLLAGLLAGCAGDTESRQQATAAQTRLVGMPEARLLSCAGVPERSADAGETRFLTYAARSVGYGGPSTSVGVGGGSGGVGLGLGLGFPLFGGSSGGSCEATFTVRNGVVQQLRYGAGDDPGQCYRIVRNCL